MKMENSWWQCYLILIAGFVSPVAEADVDYELRVGGAFTDNVRRNDLAIEDQWVAIAGLKFDASRESTRFDGSFLADLQFNKYMDDAFENENLSSFELDAEFKLAPDVFHWVVFDKFGVLQQDPFRADTPENRENVNLFETGPDLTVRLGDQGSAKLGGRYRSNKFEISNIDNTTVTGSLSLSRALSPNRILSLNGSADRIEFEDSVAYSDFDRKSAYLGFTSKISNGSLTLNIGVNELLIEGETYSGTLMGLSWSRQLTNISTINVNYNERFSDAGDLFRRYESYGDRPGDAQPFTPTGDPFEVSALRIGYDYEKERSTFLISALFSEDTYQNQTGLDSQRMGGRIGLSRGSESGWTVGADLRFETRDFETSDQQDDYLDAILRISRRLTRTVSLSFEYLYSERTSNQVGQDYSENRYTLLFLFGPQN